jgi:mannose-1-phosphate guanylyltransferase
MNKIADKVSVIIAGGQGTRLKPITLYIKFYPTMFHLNHLMR